MFRTLIALIALMATSVVCAQPHPNGSNWWMYPEMFRPPAMSRPAFPSVNNRIVVSTPDAPAYKEVNGVSYPFFPRSELCTPDRFALIPEACYAVVTCIPNPDYSFNPSSVLGSGDSHVDPWICTTDWL
jgi:hypothetical protein